MACLDAHLYEIEYNKRQTTVTELNFNAKMVFTSEHKRFITESSFRKGVFNNGQWTYVLFRTRNLGQYFFDISKKHDVNQPLVSLISDNY
jgi:hypothetical protein